MNCEVVPPRSLHHSWDICTSCTDSMASVVWLQERLPAERPAGSLLANPCAQRAVCWHWNYLCFALTTASFSWGALQWWISNSNCLVCHLPAVSVLLGTKSLSYFYFILSQGWLQWSSGSLHIFQLCCSAWIKFVPEQVTKSVCNLNMHVLQSTWCLGCLK